MKLIVLITILLLVFTKSHKIRDEGKAQKFLDYVEVELTKISQQATLAGFNLDTNVTDENQEIIIKLDEKNQEFFKKIHKIVNKFDFKNFKNESIRRQFEKMSDPGSSALNQQDFKTLSYVASKMPMIYGNATACIRGKCGLELEPDLTELMANSRDFDYLKEVWTEWRDISGKPIRHLYKQYVDLVNKVAKLNGFKSYDEMLLDNWETPDFKEQLEELWQKLRPTYQILHTYVRMKLRQKYGKRMPSDGTIPAHLLGNMWAQQWTRILDLVTPFPNKTTPDITDTLKAQNFTAIQMFRTAEKFYTDLGLLPMTEEFWNNSMFVKPKDRTVVCHASAYDMDNKKDFRIKMCTDITMVDFITIHHEMGHIEYYMHYLDQPFNFREGANPGFHESIGDSISLSVSTPAHLYKVGLFSHPNVDNEVTLNYQMSKALEKLAFIPFGYIIDLWRWDVFSGKVGYDEWNKRWWELRLKYQGISPPTNRSELDFDPGAKYHIPARTEYIRYFVSFIIQFQFHKSLCSIAQPNVPLHECDINGNKEAGYKLASALSLGSSKPWPQVMTLLADNSKIDPGPLIEYFEPLLDYMKNEIKDETIGWTSHVNQYFDN